MKTTMAKTQQLNFIVEPHPHDVLSGRGNSANRHAGNARFRSLVKGYRQDYVACPKSKKSLYSKIIYDEIRSMHPPGRFLKQDPITKLWSDIGKKAALAKTRQALREGAPDLLRDSQAVEQLRQYSTSECQAADVASVQNACNSVELNNQVLGDISCYLQCNTSSVSPSVSPGSESLLSLGAVNDDKISAIQFPGSTSNQVKAGFYGVVAESSASTQLGDSFLINHVPPNSISSQMQMTQHQIQPWQQVLGNMNGRLHDNETSAFQVPDALLQFQSSFNALENPQVGQRLNLNDDLNSDITKNSRNLLGCPTTPLVENLSNPQQQYNYNTGSDNTAALMALIFGRFGSTNNSNVNNEACDSDANNLVQLLQSQFAVQLLQSQLGVPP